MQFIPLSLEIEFLGNSETFPSDIDTRPSCFSQGVERKENISVIDRMGSVGLQRQYLLRCIQCTSAPENTIHDPTLCDAD
ncbi:Uncharacterized protein HZ326_9271 [Fusarium oxysporum f. sp. albedinis]|nr:Uncharacterized protein HZ326_9271 [Fusarium oxysporum f. sp. albedinis]